MTDKDKAESQEPKDEAQPDLDVKDEEADEVKGGGGGNWGGIADKGPKGGGSWSG
jgi:hypothetical protein